MRDMSSFSIESMGGALIGDLTRELALRSGSGVIEEGRLKQLFQDVAQCYRAWCEVIHEFDRERFVAEGVPADRVPLLGSNRVKRVIRSHVLNSFPTLPSASEINANLGCYIGACIDGCKALKPVSAEQAKT